jgi:large repetitive protein
MRWLILLASCGPKRDDSAGASDDSGESGAPDEDEDGFSPPDDCNDDDDAVHPGAVETCNENDDDCDGAIDEDATDPVAWFADHDGDGFGLDDETVTACAPPDGTWILVGGDCDDTSAAIHPDADEICDPSNTDEDCDGDADDADDSATGQGTYYTDDDGDGYGALPTVVVCDQPGGTAGGETDCDDADPDANPGAVEVCGGGDEDCDGETDETGAAGKTVYWRDSDGDGFGNSAVALAVCEEPSGYVDNDIDCDDTNALAHPYGIEICAVGDEDCDGVQEEEDHSLTDATTWYADGDGDGYGGSSSTELCLMPSGYAAATGDCDDSDAAISPGAAEVCEVADVDEDCDALVDEKDPGATGC